MDGPLNESSRGAIRRGAEAAADSLARWLGRPASIEVGRCRSVDLAGAAEVLGPDESVVAACALGFSGALSGTMLLAFDDAEGLAAVDALLGRPAGSAAGWGELERSAACETGNIVGCAFVDALASSRGGGPVVPGPPEFRRDFAASLLEFAVVGQAARGDRIVLAECRFVLGGAARPWDLLLVPDADSAAWLDAGGGPS